MTDMSTTLSPAPQPGQILARGVCRFLSDALDFACLEEFVPERGKRVDVMALGPKGERLGHGLCVQGTCLLGSDL